MNLKLFKIPLLTLIFNNNSSNNILTKIPIINNNNSRFKTPMNSTIKIIKLILVIKLFIIAIINSSTIKCFITTKIPNSSNFSINTLFNNQSKYQLFIRPSSRSSNSNLTCTNSC